MDIPNTYTELNETGCCAVPNIEEWNNQNLQFNDRPFIRMYTRSFMYVPLNMGKIMTLLSEKAVLAGAAVTPEQVMILSRDLSPWKAEHLYAVSHPVEGADNVTLKGEFLTKVFEGTYSEAKNWFKSLVNFAIQKGKIAKEVYFDYTTCPNCAKHYGKNYVIGLVHVL